MCPDFHSSDQIRFFIYFFSDVLEKRISCHDGFIKFLEICITVKIKWSLTMHSFWLCLHLELHLQLSLFIYLSILQGWVQLSLKVVANDVKLESSIFIQTSSKFVCYFSFQLFLRKVEMEFLYLPWHLSIMRIVLSTT